MEYFGIKCAPSELMERVDEYYKRLSDIGHTQKMQKSCLFYFGQNNKSSHLSRFGSQYQNTMVVVNDYRSIIQHSVTLITSNRPAYDVRATNTDYKSQTQSILGEQILDYYLREKGLEGHLKTACNYAMRYSEGFIGLDWDVNLGRIYEVDSEGNPVAEGDIQYKVYNPLQVIRDIDNDGEQDWVILVSKINKFELAARFPEHEEAILRDDGARYRREDTEIDYLLHSKNDKECEMVPIYLFYHKKSAVLPEGKMCLFLNEQLKLLEGPLPYQEVPRYRIAPDNFDNTCLGYTMAFDLLSLQEASDKLYSGVVSNNLTFCKQVLQTKRDPDFDVQDLADGLKLIMAEEEIKAVQLTKSAPETYELIKTLQSKMQELSGINEVVRGTPSPNLRSGNSLALIAAQAITYNSGIQSSYNQLIEGTGTATIRILQNYATSPRFAAIVGKYKKAFMKEYQGSDLELIDRVTVEQQGSVMRTTAGKIQLAENLLQNGLFQRPDQYLMVLETGRLDPIVESEQAEILLMRHENEMLSTGKSPVAVAVDKHDLHIKEHKAVLANPESRFEPQVVEATLAHIQEHLDLKKTIDPILLQITGTEPTMPPPPPQQGPTNNPEMAEPPGPEMPPNMPSQPKLPQQADRQTEQSYEQLQGINEEGGI